VDADASAHINPDVHAHARTHVDALREGDVVTVAYTHMLRNHNIPVNARITRIRHDLLWEDVLRNAHTERSSFLGKFRVEAKKFNKK
jgi:hypothetical protein